jgi:hypothetical protein
VEAGGGVSVGDLSVASQWQEAITSPSVIDQPDDGTFAGSSINTLDHPDGAIRGLKFEIEVPDDYDSGDAFLKIVYGMSAADPSPDNVIRVKVGAEIASVTTGLVDTATYPRTEADHTVPEDTDIVYETFLTLAEGDFGPGDKILFYVERIGNHANDDHTGIWQIGSYNFSYTGQVATRVVTQAAPFLTDTDEPPPPNGNKGNFGTMDFPPALDREKQMQLSIPDNYDGLSDLQVRTTFAMSTSESSKKVRVSTEGSITNLTTGAITTIPVENFDLLVPDDTSIERSVVVRSIPAALVGPGAVLALKIKRSGTASEDNHVTGDWQLLSSDLLSGVAPRSGFGQALIEEFYLPHHSFRKVTPAGVTGLEQDPDFGGDFEKWFKISSTVASGVMHIEFEGRLASFQTALSSVKVPIKGTVTGSYKLKIYTEAGAGTAAYDSGAQNPTVSRDELTVLQGSITPQPGTGGRYFVVVEATLNNTEELYVGRPFVRQE